MHTKKNATFLLIVVLSMLILAYITFVTVYEQILTQNNGFFNVIIYGVVLILVFIFISLFIRILTFKNSMGEKSPLLNVLKVIGIIALFGLFVFMRLRFTSSISPSESPMYNTAVYIVNNQIDQAKDIHSHIVGYPADFVYGYLLSNIFAITGIDESIYIIVNISMMAMVALFVFLTVNLIAGEACAALALVITLFMPNNGYLVYSYNSELFTAAFFICSVFLYEVLIYKRFTKSSNARVIAILCGFIGGIALSCEPVFLLAYIILTLWILASGRQTKATCFIPVIISFVETIILLFLKAMTLVLDFSQVLKGYFLCFVPNNIRDEGTAAFSLSGLFTSLTSRLNNPSKFLSDNSYFLSDSNGGVIVSDQALWLKVLDQFIYLFVLILCVLCIVYIIRVTYDKIIPLYSVFIALFIGQVLGGCNQVSYIYFVMMLIMIGSTTAYYMYFNHHPADAVTFTNEEIRRENQIIENEQQPEEEEIKEEENSEYLLRARAIVFVGEDDNLYNQIKLEEKANRENSSIAATMIKTEINEEGEYDSVKQDIEFFDEPDKESELKPVHEVVAIPSTRPVEVVKPLLADDYVEENNEIYSNESDLPVSFNDNEISANESFDTALDEDDYLDDPDVIEDKTDTIDTDTETKDDLNEEKPVIQPEGFVFRKKDDSSEAKNTEKPVKKDKTKNTDDTKKVNAKKDVKTDKKAAKEIAKSSKAADKAAKKAEKEAEKEAKKAEREAEKAAKRAAKKGMSVNQENKAEKKSLKDVKPGEPLPNPLEGPKPSNKGAVDFDFDTTDNDDFDF